MKKICIVSASPLTIKFFLIRHIEYLRSYSDVTVVYNHSIDLYATPLNTNCTKIHIHITRKINILSDILSLLKLYFLFKKNKYDLILTVSPKSGLLGMLAGFSANIKNRIHIFQGEVWSNKKGIKRNLLKFADSIIVACSTDLLCVGISEKKFLIDEKIVKEGKIAVLGRGSICGVNLKKFNNNFNLNSKQDLIREKLNISNDKILLLYVGRINSEKGVFELMKAFESVAAFNKKIELLLVGPIEDDFSSKMIKCYMEINNKIHYKNYTEFVVDYLRAADIICLPSQREGFSTILLEAAAMRIPAIGTNIPGINDVIENGLSGILIDRNKNFHESLINAIVLLAGSRSLRIAMGDYAKRMVENYYNEETVVLNYSKFFYSKLYLD